MNPDPTTAGGCVHPPARLYAWFALDARAPEGRVACVACCECGAVLQGGDDGEAGDDGEVGDD